MSRLSFPSLQGLIGSARERRIARRVRREYRDNRDYERERDRNVDRLAEEAATSRRSKEILTERRALEKSFFDRYKQAFDEEKFGYKKLQDAREGFRKDRDYGLSLSKEQRMRGEQQYQRQQEAYARMKDFTYKWIDLVQKAQSSGNYAQTKNLHIIGRAFFDGLNQPMKQLTGPILQTGPFDPRAEKLARWREANPKPEVTALPSEEPTVYATQVTDLENWGAEQTGIISGKRGTPRQIIPFGDRNYVSTRNGGGIVDEETLGLQNLAQSENTTVMKLLAEQGVTGPVRTIVADGVEHKVQSKVDLEGKFSIEELSRKDTPERKKMYKFMQEWSVWDDIATEEKKKLKNSLVMGVRKDLDAGKSMVEISMRSLRPLFKTNFVLSKHKPDPTRLIKPWTWFAEAEYGYLIPVAGELQVLKIAENKGLEIYYDKANDRVADANDGEDLGTYDEAVKYLKERFGE